jgi:hypothetical protein
MIKSDHYPPQDAEIPHDFPKGVHERVQQRVDEYRQQAGDDLWREFIEAWNGVKYRFMSTAENSDAYTTSVRQTGSATSGKPRYEQERELFEFFFNGQSAVESACYGLYVIG